MVLVRRVGLGCPQAHLGPVPRGTFWAPQGLNDLPNGPTAVLELRHMLRRGRVWVQDVLCPDTWVEVTRGTILPAFKGSWEDDYDACEIRIVVKPFMPEFYFIPSSNNGRRMVERAERRALRRTLWENTCLLRGWVYDPEKDEEKK